MGENNENVEKLQKIKQMPEECAVLDRRSEEAKRKRAITPRTPGGDADMVAVTYTVGTITTTGTTVDNNEAPAGGGSTQQSAPASPSFSLPPPVSG